MRSAAKLLLRVGDGDPARELLDGELSVWPRSPGRPKVRPGHEDDSMGEEEGVVYLATE